MDLIKKQRALLVVAALTTLYFVWGSTFLAMRFAIESFPPFMMAAIRFTVAGGMLFLILLIRGYAFPTLIEWRNSAVVGIMLLSIGNAGVAYAEQSVSSGVAALAIATVPLWMALFGSIWQKSPNQREWLGILIGTVGIVILHLGHTMQASPFGAMILLGAAASWALGSTWGRHLTMPTGAMASATQMLTGGIALIIASLIAGETWPSHPSEKSIYAIIYLIIFGSFIAYSAYLFLLDHVRPALATSYAFVNPVVALLLGAWLANEVIGRAEFMALAIIIVGVLLVLPLKRDAQL
ncbi:drug/metabolite exporter YedA [Methylovorus sp. MM2]|uniref:drug/metabolite exporter YedA n=1 Tax=Methylovorus sp. MM2 TaxID=1848038 RepID=UPI0007DFBAEB|nr:drug/metabolite exporter YedA [Methylovorus sp. MM2]OAM51536.1 drug/metabolite exporter YedA [Methylovorus sp. MM2]